MEPDLFVCNLHDLAKAVEGHKAIIVPESKSFNKPTSAAFIMNLSGKVIFDLINKGMYVYRKGEVE
jgi:hypothetical protein